VNAHDIERAVGFLSRDARNEAFVHRAAEPRFLRLQWNPPDAVAARKAEFDHPGSIIYFNVENIEQAAQTLSARGGQFEEHLHLSPTWARTISGLQRFAIRKATCSR